MQRKDNTPAKHRVDAWNILHDYAHGLIETLPEVEEHLKVEERLSTCLGKSYKPEDWKGVIDTILHTEDDVVAASKLVEQHQSAALAQTCSGSINIAPLLPQLKRTEESLMASVDDLKQRQRIHGTAPTLEELLNPVEEQKDYEDTHIFKTDQEIILEVHCRFQDASVIDANSESDEDITGDAENTPAKPTLHDGQDLCIQMEKLALEHAETETALTLTRTL
ncbi:hypothetical protein A7U60_g2328 [Sanghuangporus baumii]|uniref:Uncharacterized protein n=1 Tax=Sanghuangporus baumii TaxID=108892 RepID=A0A9Q5I2E5_SANBA|nr:hypothetical protein A7U60_g2328 [Sanghuangporus baumii]